MSSSIDTPITIRREHTATGEVTFEDLTVRAVIERALERAKNDKSIPRPFYTGGPHPENKRVTGAYVPVEVGAIGHNPATVEIRFVVIPPGTIVLPYSSIILPDHLTHYLEASVLALKFGDPMGHYDALWDPKLTILGDGDDLPPIRLKANDKNNKVVGEFIEQIEDDYPYLKGGLMFRPTKKGYFLYVRLGWDRMASDLARLRDSWQARVDQLLER